MRFLGLFDIQLPDFMNNQYSEFVLLLLLWAILGIAISVTARMVIGWALSGMGKDIVQRIYRILGAPIILLVFLYGLIQSLQVLDEVPFGLTDDLMWVFTITSSLVVVYLIYKVFKAVFIPLGSEYSKKKGMYIEDTVIPIADKLGGTIILLLGLFWILTIAGVNVTVFLAGMGVAGLVLAFALQDTLSNYFAGLHLMMDRPFKPGDLILVGEDYCRVIGIGFRSTRLYNLLGHEIWTLPNNIIANQLIVNKTEPDVHLRVGVEVGVAYGSPTEKVREIIMEGVERTEGIILDDPEKKPSVRFRSFGDSSLNFRVLFFVRDLMDQWRIGDEVRDYINMRFEEEGITIPFPQRTISFLDAPGSMEIRELTESS